MNQDQIDAKKSFEEGMSVLPLNVQAMVTEEIKKACSTAKFLCDSRTDSRQAVGLAIATGICIALLEVIESVPE